MNTNVIKPVRFGDQIEIEIQSLAFGGDSVGRYQDFAIFVPGGLPGERVRVKINQVKDHYASGEILSILRPSPDRVAPTCSIFEECGGCQWQHFNYPMQLKTKRQFVVDSLQRIGRLTNVTVQPCLPSPTPYAYRNKAMPVISMRDGHFVSGIYEPRSHHLVPYHTCPIQGDALNDFIQQVLKKVDRSGLTPYQEKKHTGFLRHLAVRQGFKTGEILLAFVTRTEVPEDRLQKPTLLPEELDQILPRIAQDLMRETPGLVGVLQNINPSRTNIVFGPATKVLAGRDHYFEIIDDLKLKVSLKSFLQVNTPQADILHAVVREALGDPLHKKKWGTVLDLYSGIGTLALAVSGKADYVVGVEEVGPAVDDAKVNAELNQKNNIDFLEGDVAHILLGLKEKGLSQIDAAILDPPRKGVLPEVLARVAAFQPERLVYVSCDPATLARDLALLAKQGYGVDWAQPLDMFPQTYHVETVVRLTRETPLPPEILAPSGESKLEPFRLPKTAQGPTLNIQASLRAVGENASAFGGAFLRLAKVSLGLVGSVAAGMAGLALKGFHSLGKGLPKANPPAAPSGMGGLEKAIQAGMDSDSKAVDPIPVTPFPDPEVSVPLSPERPTAPPVEFSQAETAVQDKPGSIPGPVLPVEPVLASRAAQTTLSEPVVSASIPPTTTEPALESPLRETAPPPAPAPDTADSLEPASPDLSQEEAGTPLEPILEQAVVQEPPTIPVPEEPLVPAPLAAAAAAIPPAPLEKSAAEPGPPAPSAAPPAPPRKMRWPKLAWRSPSIRISLPRLEIHKSLRWVLTAAFLAGGVVLAKATFSPTLKKTAVLVPTVSQMIPDVIAVMPTRNFLRYEMVPFEVRVNPEELPHFPEMHAVVKVYRGGVPVTMVDNRSTLNLKKDASNGRFLGNWPIPYNPAPGTYVAQVVVSGPQWEEDKIFETAFTISPLKPNGLYPGYAALTMEGGKQLVGGAVPALDGGDALKAANAIEWARFMGANLYCYLMGQTSIWDHLNPREFPFSHGDMEVGRKYAKLAHQAGLKFAGYMTTFKVVGDAWNQAPYQFSLTYDPDTDQVVQSRFISLEDPRRRQDIVDFLKDLDQDPDIDMIGLDYVRTGPAGYEMVDEFVKDLNVPGPSNFWSLSKEERVHWLAKTVELKEDPQVVELFQWWRAHKVALTLKDILEEAKVSKPVFTFTLGWQMGHQHGQDPAMFVDAGVNYNHIMLYEGDRNTLVSMKHQWPEYLSRANGMYAMGEMVDFNWVQKSIDPPGPEELYDREVDTFNSWFQVNSSVGMFWHDLYRICYGVRGPYSSMEWAIAGGKAFTAMKEAEGLSPIEVSIEAPRSVPAGVPVPIRVEVRNHSPQDLTGLVLHQIDTSKNYYTDLATVGPFDLPAGNLVRVKSLYVNLPRENQPERDNRYMAAVLVEKPGQSLRSFDFTYLKKISSGAARRSDAPAGGSDTGSTPQPNNDSDQ